MNQNFINLYLVRHSQAYHNIRPENYTNEDEERINNMVDPVLTEDGIRMIDFSKEQIKNVEFRAIFSSPLSRCIQTSNLLINNSEIILDDRLLELTHDNEIHNKKQLKEIIIKFIRSLENKNNTFNLDFVNDDSYIFGEKNDSIIYKILISFFTDIQNKYPNGSNILIITHGRLLKFIYEKILKKKEESIFHNAQIKKLLLYKNAIKTNKENHTIILNNIIEKLFNKLKENQRLLTIDEIYFIIKNIIGTNLCNFYLIKKFIRLISKFINDNLSSINLYDENIKYDDFKFYLNNNNLTDNFYCEYIYFHKITEFIKTDHTIFSLGDSLNKINLFWNFKNPDYKIINIPLSGSIYEYNETNKIVLNESSYTEMISKLGKFIENNDSFRLMLKLLSEGKKVLITDYMLSGKSLFTFIKILKELSVSLENVNFLYILNNIESQVSYYEKKPHEQLITEFNYINPIHYINIGNKSMFDVIHTNSEFNNSRCTPKYIYDMWDSRPDDVYSVENYKNYFNCNLHTLLFTLSNLCFYDFFYKTNKTITDYNILYDKIKSFVTENESLSDYLSNINKKLLKQI
jgi:broad specificity phosphatase PhoE